MSQPAIVVRDVHKSFGAARGLDGLDLVVERGAVFGFLGPNGAGKTTTLRILLGLMRPDSGEVLVAGLDPLRDGVRVRAQVGVLLENDGLYDRLTGLQNLDYHARLHHLVPAARTLRAEELLRMFGLWERRHERVSTWSKGMRQRLALGRALMHRPALLLLDEPFTGLDPVGASELRQTLVTLAREQQVTVLLTTHDLAHVEKACERIAVIDKGRVIAEGEPNKLGGDPEIEVEVSGSGLNEAVLEELVVAGLITRFQFLVSARVYCTPSRRARLGTELLARGVELLELHTVRRSLEDVFLQLMRRA